ncbi:hypothetical protein [Lacimonas salitolerans]|uniref:Uncharacterized protein n=1 Tax=Lacimonas salitolerans TaxID=1323750 RepID=A0ABW4E988_9RHOB
MRQAVIGSILAGFLVSLAPAAVLAGPIDRACNSSPRKQKSPALCACIQAVADQSLTRREQRQAARFFRDPHRAQEMRQSSSADNKRFWLRYRAFGAQAEQRCS